MKLEFFFFLLPSSFLYDYALSLYSYWVKCHCFILQMFPFTCVSSLYNHFAVDMNMHKNYICSKKYAKFLIESYNEIFNTDSSRQLWKIGSNLDNLFHNRSHVNDKNDQNSWKNLNATLNFQRNENNRIFVNQTHIMIKLWFDEIGVQTDSEFTTP